MELSLENLLLHIYLREASVATIFVKIVHIKMAKIKNLRNILNIFAYIIL